MPRASHNRTLARREEIVDACEQLYRTMSFKEITLKKIGEVTSFTRTSIYNYFRTREEIFLALFEREYRLWGEDLEAILARDRLSRAEFSQELGRSLAARPNLLKLLSMNMYDIEENSRVESLTEFKLAYGRALSLVRACLERFFGMDKEASEGFLYAFFPFLYGVYPYANATPKQEEAMRRAGVAYLRLSAAELCSRAALRLLEGSLPAEN